MTTEQPPSDRATVRRVANRGRYDRPTISAILDEALLCHVAITLDGQPFILPMAFGHDGDAIYLHGSRGSRLMKTITSGAPICVTVTLIDGLVLARSAFHHSMNYRSVVILGSAQSIDTPEEKTHALQIITDHLVPERWNDCRPMSEAERNATTVARLPLTEASAKVRTGPPIDDESDYALPIWAGVIPLTLTPGSPEPDPRLQDGLAPPHYADQGSKERHT